MTHPRSVQNVNISSTDRSSSIIRNKLPRLSSVLRSRGPISPSGMVHSPSRVEPKRRHRSMLHYPVVPSGQRVPCSVDAKFTPHIITVNSGEDVSMKIMSLSQQRPRAICILSANGVLSSVTLRQPGSFGGTLTYEGRFEILSLSGSFIPNGSGGTRSRCGAMSVSLASPNGTVVGGGVAGQLVAASPVQVMVGSFLAGDQHEQKKKKQKNGVISTVTPTTAVVLSYADPIPNFSSLASFLGENWSAMPMVADTGNNPTDNKGRFEILSLSGSFIPNGSGGTRSRCGAMSISLASTNGTVVGGGVAGQLVAASPVQVVVGSFLAGDQHEQKKKK